MKICKRLAALLLILVLLISFASPLSIYAEDAEEAQDAEGFSEPSESAAQTESTIPADSETDAVTGSEASSADDGIATISSDTLTRSIGTVSTVGNSSLNLRSLTRNLTYTTTGEHGVAVQQTVSNLDWHAVGTDSDVVYCICPDLSFGAGSGFDSVTGVTIGSEPDDQWYTDQGYTWGNPQDYGLQVWDSFTANQQYAIMLTLYYGCPNSLWDATAGTSTTGIYASTWSGNSQVPYQHNPNIGYRAATQAIIREIIAGWRNTTGTYAIKSEYANIYLDAYDGMCTSSDGSVDYFEYAYNYIEDMLAKHNAIPSFAASTAASAPVYEVTGTTLNLSDTNGVADLFSYPSGGGMTFTASSADTVVGTKTGAVTSATIMATRTVFSPADSTVTLIFAKAKPDFQVLVQLSTPATTTKAAYFAVQSTSVPFTLQKTISGSSTVQSEISGNSMYSLEGATYTVYANGTYSETLTTDATGQAASSKSYAVGTVIRVQETAAPTGYKLDSTWQEFTITSGTNTFTVSDEPVFDPPFAITKVDKNTTTAQGDSSFSGAVFKFEYFDNDSWSGTATRTWYFQTDSYGEAYYDSTYLASGYTSDALYVDANGNVRIPLGTVKMTEVVNSLGYTVLPDSLYLSIVEDSTASSGAKFVWTSASLQYVIDMRTGNYEKYGIYEPADESLYGSLTIQKTDSMLGTSLPDGISFAGCEFAVYNMSTNSVKISDFDIAQPGEVCYTFSIDSTGQFSTGNIFPIGTYEVVETKGNDYYQVNADWSYTFTVTDTGSANSFTFSCPNAAVSGQISILKIDPNDVPLAGAKFLLEWSADGTVWAAVTSTEGMGYCSSADLADGTLTSGVDGKVTFTGLYPGLQYRLTEVGAPDGYSLLTDTAWEGQLTDYEDYTVSLRVVNSQVYTLPATGAGGLWMFPFVGTSLLLALSLYFIRKKTVK